MAERFTRRQVQAFFNAEERRRSEAIADQIVAIQEALMSDDIEATMRRLRGDG